jgi:hypothetical protein
METTSQKPQWEIVLRRKLGLPRHHTANDNATVLLRVGFIFALVSLLLFFAGPWYLSYTVFFAAVDFAGLGVQQYAFYTGRVYTECWEEEGAPVVALVTLTSCVLGGISLLLFILFANSPVIQLLIFCTLHGGLLSSYRWQFWGSFFDGNDKLHAAGARRNY